MSTPQPRSDARAAAKRRAANRRRNRELLRRLAAIFFVFIFVIGTATTAFVFSQQGTAVQAVPTTVAQSSNPGTTPAPGAAGQTPQVADTLVKQADAAAKGDNASAISYYQAALGLSPGNATVQYKLGKALIAKGSYKEGVANLQEAVSSNPSAAFIADANTLISQYKDKPDTATTAGATPAGTAAGAAGTAAGGAATVAPATTGSPATK